MNVSLLTTAIAAPQGIAPVTDPSSSLQDVAHNIMAADKIQQQLSKAMQDLDNPDASSILNTQLLTAELSVMTATASSAVKSLSDTTKNLFQNGF